MSKIASTTKKYTPKMKTAMITNARGGLNFLARRRYHLAHLRAHIGQEPGELFVPTNHVVRKL